ncbi:gamma-glutamyl-gamma-aminobutyrate hydrolase family protein [Dactylosporangium fulvum]|uniref:Gamma-glutamyl-gamma-aminobutyrate hydrolase family protein n=1 Tax=Dactylosporangium fulvum TaxID=53359 RepID=A0ABY5VPA9_9ACTN|nr:gamma-glutamyl-gamma-aminobutyrate hydrolase family protein [Dactylosporangium fulvum]UWP78987.1 gamma-glutamyl-gamma-aminobutyrate hydrolase family protein [Dactylosporangium fulvum]
MNPPVIGICAAYERAAWAFWDQPAAIVAGTYVDKVRAAGGVPVALIPDPRVADDPGLLLGRVDGLLLVGGADIDPPAYGARRSPRTEATVPLRDRSEIALASAALAADLPVLGICRGLQILNVATGGTLHQHLPDEGFAEHRAAPGRLDGPAMHPVATAPGSLAEALAGPGVQSVNSHHHQGIARIGTGAVVTAWSLPDKLPEALEWPAHRYALGVQWHPEAVCLAHTFAGLVRAAAGTGPAAGARTDQERLLGTEA